MSFFRSNVTDLYGNHIETVDFSDIDARRTEINTLIQNETRNSIKNFLPEGSVDAITNGILLNAAFFKGFWANPFDRTQTEDKPFGNGDRTVPMMRIHGHFKFGLLNCH